MYRTGKAIESELQLINAQLEADIVLLNEFYTTIVATNEPSVLKEDNKEMLYKISNYNFETLDDDFKIITEQEFDLLSIREAVSPPANEKRSNPMLCIHRVFWAIYLGPRSFRMFLQSLAHTMRN
jgi:hypothetical protein